MRKYGNDAFRAPPQREWKCYINRVKRDACEAKFSSSKRKRVPPEEFVPPFATEPLICDSILAPLYLFSISALLSSRGSFKADYSLLGTKPRGFDASAQDQCVHGRNFSISGCARGQNAHWAFITFSIEVATLNWFNMLADDTQVGEETGKSSYLHYQDDHAYGSEQILVIIQPSLHFLKAALKRNKTLLRSH